MKAKTGNIKTKLRNKTDKLLQDYIRLKHQGETCFACGERKVSVGHHFIPVSNSNALRYYVPNLIPLCKNCHCLVHTQPHLVEPKICFFMGSDWYEDLMQTKRKLVKTTLGWYQMNFDILSQMYNEEISRRENRK